MIRTSIIHLCVLTLTALSSDSLLHAKYTEKQSKAGSINKEHYQRVIKEFFSNNDIGFCEDVQYTEISCHDILNDAVIFEELSASLILIPSHKNNPTLSALNNLPYDKVDGFKRAKLLKLLPKLNTIFICIKDGCGSYSTVPEQTRKLSVHGYKDAISYLYCLSAIPADNFDTQAIISWFYYYDVSNKEHINKRLIEANQFGSKYHRFLFIEPDQFEECKNISVSYNSLDLIMRLGKSMRPGTF